MENLQLTSSRRAAIKQAGYRAAKEWMDENWGTEVGIGLKVAFDDTVKAAADLAAESMTSNASEKVVGATIDAAYSAALEAADEAWEAAVDASYVVLNDTSAKEDISYEDSVSAAVGRMVDYVYGVAYRPALVAAENAVLAHQE